MISDPQSEHKRRRQAPQAGLLACQATNDMRGRLSYYA